MKPTYDELEAKLVNTEALLKLALERIAKLEERLNANSKNSSKPPSTDHKANSKPKKSGSRKSRKGASRTVYPPEKVDTVVACTLDQCPGCGSKDLIDEQKPLMLQQVELPEVKATVTQFNCAKYRCCGCGEHSFAHLPPGIPNSAFGVRLMALITMLTGAFHLSKRDAMQLVQDLYGVELAEGSVINIEERVASALKEIDERIHQFVMNSGLAKHFDETSWRDSGKGHYVWIGSNVKVASYRIDRNRSRDAFERVFGKIGPGAVVTDRYSVYSNIENPHQYCLAHLIREFRKYAERDGPDRALGEVLKSELQKVCKNHREFRKGNISQRSRDARFRHQKRRLEDALIDGLANGTDELAGLCNRLLDKMHKLWTFSEFSDVEPTNNLAERDLRKIVLWRKKSYGTRSERGKRFVERITSVVATARKTGRNVFEFLCESVSAFYLGIPAPLLDPALGF